MTHDRVTPTDFAFFVRNAEHVSVYQSQCQYDRNFGNNLYCKVITTPQLKSGLVAA